MMQIQGRSGLNWLATMSVCENVVRIPFSEMCAIIGKTASAAAQSENLFKIICATSQLLC